MAFDTKRSLVNLFDNKALNVDETNLALRNCFFAEYNNGWRDSS
jgi:hypothetical protein